MNDSHSLDNLSLTAGPTDLGDPKTKPIAPAPDDPKPRAPAAEPVAAEDVVAPKRRCADVGHSWVRDSKESGSGQPGHAARHYSCNRDGCRCRQTCTWNGDRWVATVEGPKP